MKSLTDKNLISLCIKTLQHADAVLSYIPGDPWEREVTENDRMMFDDGWETIQEYIEGNEYTLQEE
jgi:hypothetical protein